MGFGPQRYPYASLKLKDARIDAYPGDVVLLTFG